MNITSLLLPTLSSPHVQSTLGAVSFMEEQHTSVRKSLYTSQDSFVDFPLEDIRLSLESADISIPNHLQTVDEMDEWIMSL